MEAKNVLHELSVLRAEHAIIQERLQQLQSFRRGMVKSEELEVLKTTMQFVHDHHVREEAFLFPWLANQEWLREGGPRCTDFMGRRLCGLSPSQQIVKKEGLVFLKPDYLASTSSLLTIPLEEHQVGSYLAGKILERIEQGEDGQVPSFQILVSKWMDLVEDHRRKEDDCLFKMIESRLQR